MDGTVTFGQTGKAQASIQTREFAIALGAGLSIFFVAADVRISLTELGAVIAFPFIVYAAARSLNPGWTAGLILCLLGFVPGGLLGASSFDFVMLGHAVLVLLLGWAIAGADMLSGGSKWVLGGFVAGQVVGLLLTPPAALGVAPWKFGWGQAVTLAVLLLVELRRPSMRSAILIGLLLMAVHLALGSRTLCVLTGAAVVGAIAQRNRARPDGDTRRRDLRRVVLVSALVLGLALCVQWAYVAAATDGRLGAGEKVKVASQTGDFGLVVGGRKDFVIDVFAVQARPVVGYGPEARTPTALRLRALVWLESHDYETSEYEMRTFFRPVDGYQHSVVLGTAVRAGVGASLFWLTLLIVLIRAAFRIFGAGRPMLLFIYLQASWHLLFSPIGDVTRVFLGLALGLAISQTIRSKDRPEAIPR